MAGWWLDETAAAGNGVVVVRTKHAHAVARRNRPIRLAEEIAAAGCREGPAVTIVLKSFCYVCPEPVLVK